MNSNAQIIARESKSSFYYAFNLLGKERSEAMNIVYAFCRKTDDIVDEEQFSVEEKEKNLADWKKEFELALEKNSDDKLLSDLTDTISRYNISSQPFFDLIRGMKMDLEKNRFQTFEETEEYCYCAASTVGLMSVAIFGYKHDSIHEYAVNLGKALQLTNIIRDVKTDTKMNRIYLPLEDFERFGYTEEELFNGVYNSNFYELMNFQAERAQKYFDKADSLLHLEDKKNMFAAQAMRHIYYKLLTKLRNNKFDIFSQNINVDKRDKLFIALGTWFKYTMLY
ncbi:MAG: phytoene/squalene synthase family protein [Rhodothermaceae bacterium]